MAALRSVLFVEGSPACAKATRVGVACVLEARLHAPAGVRPAMRCTRSWSRGSARSFLIRSWRYGSRLWFWVWVLGLGYGYDFGSGLWFWVWVMVLGYGFGSGLWYWVWAIVLSFGFGSGLWFWVWVWFWVWFS